MTILFRFRLDATVDGEPFLSMRDGCAGFFTPEQLAAGRGIVPHSIDLRARAAQAAASIPELIPGSRGSLDAPRLDALWRGDLAGAFGPPFDRATIDDPLPLPGDRLKLLHRVTSFDSAGGSCRLGFISAEAEIHPDDWFLVCHFVDDHVMPGTLMYESCLQALRILLMRMGSIGRRLQVAFEPVPGVAIRLKCRGQVVASTKLVTYEVTHHGARLPKRALCHCGCPCQSRRQGDRRALRDITAIDRNEPARAGGPLERGASGWRACGAC